jgi:hypothetical protein
MIAYVSRMGGERRLAPLRAAGWRLLVSAKGVHRSEGFRYAIDNGAWTAFTKGEPFDFAAFEQVVRLLGSGADWIVAPDIVQGGLESLEVSKSWLPRLVPIAPVLIAVQDGMTPGDVWPLLNSRIGLFVGGSTEWKLRTLPEWGELARQMRCHFHVGRVNTVNRIYKCIAAGAHSFDGSSVAKWGCNLRRLDGARRQEAWRW